MKILYEDNHLIAVDKPAGILTHSDKTGDECMTEKVKKYIKKKYNKPGAVFLNPVHRLDRPVSGLLLFAKTSKATTRMTVAFKEKQIKKTYLAVSHTKPNQVKDTITSYLLKHSKTNTTSVVNKTKNGSKLAVLEYDLIGTVNKRSILKVTPKTGRSHQIRVQLSSIGCSIIGDVKYGSTIQTNGRIILLHSFSLEFIHPVKKENLLITCIPETEFWRPYTAIIQTVL